MPNWKLYCIIDRKLIKRRSPVKIAKALFKDGADIVQIRFKNFPSYRLLPIVKQIQKSASSCGKILIINDRPDVVLAAGANGVHLGSGDLSVKTVRRLLKPRSVIGKTVHSAKEAENTRFENVDYLGVGPVFKTPLKRYIKERGVNFVRKIGRLSPLPLFAIGGINKDNAKTVLAAGVRGICVARAISDAKTILKRKKK
ncbi:MAG: thiamine phosphate synthase [Candidatus Omnitrophica bacterium]|nr:thiamine phosphate synthase [Candidatus Omnitrophota bacterium]